MRLRTSWYRQNNFKSTLSTQSASHGLCYWLPPLCFSFQDSNWDLGQWQPLIEEKYGVGCELHPLTCRAFLVPGPPCLRPWMPTCLPTCWHNLHTYFICHTHITHLNTETDTDGFADKRACLGWHCMHGPSRTDIRRIGSRARIVAFCLGWWRCQIPRRSGDLHGMRRLWDVTEVVTGGHRWS